MFWFLYNLLFHAVYLLLLPRFLLRMRRRGGYRKDFGERLFRVSEAKRRRLSEGRRIWIHAVSVGEWGVASAFMREWRTREPEARFLVTVNTSTAHRLAEQALGEEDVLLYPPLDSPPVLRRLLSAVDPRALVLVETELWPNLLKMIRSRGAPVMLLNGRVSDRSYRRLKRVRFFTRRVYPLVDRFCMQSGRDARRMVGLGAPPDRVKVVHSIKYDGMTRNADEEARRRARLVESGFLREGSVVLLGSSTWPGEEKALAAIQRRFSEWGRVVDLKLVLVPRHFERREEVVADCRAAGVEPVCWSDATDEALGRADALIVDTTGELKHFTALADRVFIGKSLYRPEGQNPLEAAFAGKWIVTGPGMNNFHQIMADLREADAVVTVSDVEGLEREIRFSIDQREAAHAMGERARGLVLDRQGGLAGSAGELGALLG